MPNPMIFIQQMMQNQNAMQNNDFKNAVGMMNNNDVQGLQKLAESLCKQKGVNLSDIQQQVCQRFGIR